MVTTRQRVQKDANGHANVHAPERPRNGSATGPDRDEKTDYSRWRLLDEDGRHTWHYLTTEKEVEAWPQTIADKFHLGLATVSAHECYLHPSDRHRIFPSFLWQPSPPSPFRTAWRSTQSYNYPLETGPANMAGRSSYFPAS